MAQTAAATETAWWTFPEGCGEFSGRRLRLLPDGSVPLPELARLLMKKKAGKAGLAWCKSVTSKRLIDGKKAKRVLPTMKVDFVKDPVFIVPRDEVARFVKALFYLTPVVRLFIKNCDDYLKKLRQGRDVESSDEEEKEEEEESDEKEEDGEEEDPESDNDSETRRKRRRILSREAEKELTNLIDGHMTAMAASVTEFRKKWLTALDEEAGHEALISSESHTE